MQPTPSHGGQAEDNEALEATQRALAPAPTDAPLTALAPDTPGPTLLPPPLARAVSLSTRSLGLALRVGTLVSGYSLGAAKATTLSGLELSRCLLETVLERAGADVVEARRRRRGRGRSGPRGADEESDDAAEAETILGRSVEALHRTVSTAAFWTAAGFEVAASAVAGAADASRLLLASLDQVLGSTESSRAVASIVALVRREMQNPATGRPGERVGVVDLILGLCALAYLQQRCRGRAEEDRWRRAVEEVVWDVIVADDGDGLDVLQARVPGAPAGARTDDRERAAGAAAVAAATAADSLEADLKRQIIGSIPPDTEVAITSTVSTTRTITVDVTGRLAAPIAPPPGVEMVQEERACGSASRDDAVPSYRAVYRIAHNQETMTRMRGEGACVAAPGFVIGDAAADEVRSPTTTTNTSSKPEEEEEEEEEKASAWPEPPPPVPPKPRPREKRPSSIPTPSASAASPGRRGSHPSPRRDVETSANQKRPRMPLAPPSSLSASNVPPPRKASTSPAPARSTAAAAAQPPGKPPEKKGGFRSSLLRKGSVVGLGSLRARDDAGRSRPAQGKPAQTDKPRGVPSRFSVPGRASSLASKREAPPPRPQQHAVTSRPARPPSAVDAPPKEPFPRSSSRASFVSVHERRRDSIVSQTDTYSLHSTADTAMPLSPGLVRTEAVVGASVCQSRSEEEIVPDATSHPHRRGAQQHQQHQQQQYAHARTPSIYTLRTHGSDMSLALVPPHHHHHGRSAFADQEALATLRRVGLVDGTFPPRHLLHNLDRYARFASASYGSAFLRLLRIAKATPPSTAAVSTTTPPSRAAEPHRELRSFARHTGLDPAAILLCSFVDPQGGSDSRGATASGVPLVHYLALDHAARAVVLACRGTLGFEDVLADLACDYDELPWRGRAYRVHKGVHASARRLLYGGDGRVLRALRAALDAFPDYGVVLTGHSLGGAVTALLGVLLAEPALASGVGFVTSGQPHHPYPGEEDDDAGRRGGGGREIVLPAGRPIHVYAYGPPAAMSAALGRATRGLVTSVVHGRDLVPYLSLGVLHDLQAVALAFKSDNGAARAEVRQRLWEAFQAPWQQEQQQQLSPKQNEEDNEEEDAGAWAYAALKVLRASMMSDKLVPPGEVFVVESTPALRREAFLSGGGGGGGGLGGGGEGGGRTARRVVLRHVRDAEARFREMQFGTSMLTDHSPGKYEEALRQLRAGVVGGEP